MNSQFHARIPEMARNLRHLYTCETTDSDKALGSAWYDDAHRIMREWSDRYGYSIATCANVTAALSPQVEWTRNLIIADDILAGRPASIGGIRANVIKAIALRDNPGFDTRAVFKSGPKVYRFSQNLAGNYSVVTVDTHALQAALGDVEVTLDLKETAYDAFAQAYTLAADSLSLEPAVFQAIVWHTWKRLYPRAVKLQRRRQWHVMGEVD
jgi:hypothetical protein